ncbi:MAG: sensor histidine kinase [Alphaproteobacteria bacterium]
MKANQYLRAYYTDLVRSYVLHQEERFLVMAADLGRSALRRDVPLEEIVELHNGVLLGLAASHPRMGLTEAVRLTSPPLMEVLMAYGMAFREHMEQRRTMEEQLLEARDTVEIASNVKTDFLANMSHELRTPLNAVLGFAEMLDAEIFGPIGDEHYREYAQSIGEAGRRLLDLINDLLEASRIGGGFHLLNEEEVGLYETVTTCLRMMQMRAEHNGLQVETDLPPGLPNVRVDRLRFKQILLNLLSNAMKFTPRGGRITVKVRENAADEIVLSIIDTGIGMRPEDIPRALAPFVQLDTGTARRFEGPGLGLALAKSLIEQHDGKIELRSQLGVGTEAEIRLPPHRVVRSTYCI